MQPPSASADAATRRHRPKTLTVFAAAFAAGAVLAYGVDRVVDVHVVQAEPQVESEPIFVALRSLPQGAPVTVWDVALKDWPKAMMPTTALKADASLDGMVLRMPVREGQPLLSVQLVRDASPLPSASVASAPAAAWPTAQPADPSPAPASAAAPSAPPATERFIPAPPAEPAVAAVAGPAPVADLAPLADVASAVTAAIEDVAVPATADVSGGAAIADTDIEPAVESFVPPVVEPLPAVVAAVPDRVADPALVAVVEPLPALVAEAGVATVAIAEPTIAQAEPGPSPGVPAPAPLAAPVPSLPTTDIERSLAGFGRQAPKAEQPATPAASVLDRSTAEPTPVPTQATPKQHLVIPERVALAADASFTERPQPATEAPTTPSLPKPGVAATERSVAPGGAPPARMGNRTPQTASITRKSAAATPAPRRPASAARQSPSAKPAAARPQARPATQQTSKPTAAPQAQQATGMSAWFQQFTGGTRQR